MMYLKNYNLKNKTAVVTGAGKGLGRACAIALAESGANLIIISRTKKDLDEVCNIKLKYDWDTLRNDIRQHGLRHSTLSAQMPSESSSIVSNATNGVEPPRGYLSIKKSKKGPLKQIVPQFQSLKKLLYLALGNARQRRLY